MRALSISEFVGLVGMLDADAIAGVDEVVRKVAASALR